MNLEELLGVEGKTLVMSEEDMRTYVFDRKLSDSSDLREMQLKGLKGVIIHNAKKTQEVEDALSGFGLHAVKYYPQKSSEAHFYVPETGNIHVVNSRGVTRLERDKSLALVLGYFIGNNLTPQIDNYETDPAKASHRFEHFAFQLVEDIFMHMRPESIQSTGRLNLVLGPHKTLMVEPGEFEHENKNDFLNYKILKIGNEPVINFDYIFADQARNVLHKICAVVSAKFRGVNINLFHYGRAGILDNNLSIGDILLPNEALDEEKIKTGRRRGSRIYNELSHHTEAEQIFKRCVRYAHIGTTINSISVLGQTRESLEQAVSDGGRFLDMEWASMAALDNGYESIYPNLGGISYYFAGIGSDKPLQGRTLGNTEYPVGKERVVASAFKEIIRSF